ncbi:MAG TPA: adenylate/guanylate cyclase domain-containing protein [Steroidobacteraceae bacterium]
MWRAAGQALQRILLSAVPLLFFVLHAAGVLPLELVQRVENYLYDVRVGWMMPDVVDPRIVIVDIDEASLAAEGQWPWPRRKIAALNDALFDGYGIRAAGFDVLFGEPERNAELQLIDAIAAGPLAGDTGRLVQLEEIRRGHEGDRLLAESLIARDVVLGYVFKQKPGSTGPATTGELPPPVTFEDPRIHGHDWLRPQGYAASLRELQQAAPAGGFFDTPLTDEDGVVRRVPLFQYYNGNLYESLSFALARLAQGAPPVRFAFDADRPQRLAYAMLGDRRVPIDGQGAVLIPFRGPLGSFRYVSATDVLNARAPADALKDAIVLVGASAPGLQDVRAVPVAKEYIGVEAHANLVSGLLDGTIPSRPRQSAFAEILALLAVALVTALLLPRLAPLAGFGLFLFLIGAALGLNLVLWARYGLVLPLAGVLVYTTIAALLQLTWGYFTATRRRQRLSRIFGQYVPAEIVSELDAGGAEVSLEGESREMTVLFSDVRGFTTISEGLTARELTQLMNEFLTPITAAIHRHRGTIDKYMGDAVMAFWGAPLADPGHASHAVQAAQAMVAEMRALKPAFEARGWPAIEIGVGLSSGEMNVGNMGSQFRAAYTVLGDAVNLGSRLEGLTKTYGVNIIVSERTVALAPGLRYRELDRVRVKGKKEPVGIYEPIAAADEAAAASFAAALARYRAADWDRAETLITELSAAAPHPLYQLYLGRIRHFRAAPPPPDWDGVFTFDVK